MPFVDHQGVRIHFQVEGAGPSLVLQHSASVDMSFWNDYNLDGLKNHYQLVLIDARGHGQSDRPHIPSAYANKLMVGDVIAVLDSLNVTRTHFWGYSMGGKIGYGLAKHYPNRLFSLIIGGSTPYEDPEGSLGRLKAMLQICERGLEKGVDAFIEGLVTEWGVKLSPAHQEHLRSLDLHVMVALGRQRISEQLDFRDLLPSMTIPCLIYAGDEDEPVHSRSKQAAVTVPNATFVSLPGFDHEGAGARGDLILPHVEAFLAKVRTNNLKSAQPRSSTYQWS